MKLFSLEGQTALISGASSGLGAHFATLLAKQGAHVIVTARREDKLADLVAKIRASGGNADAVAMDVTDPASVNAALNHCVHALPAVDILINNAGIAAEPTRALDTDDETWNTQIETNLNGAWRVARGFAQQRVQVGQPGVIVNTASIYGLRTGAMKIAYNVSKAGLVQMTKSLSVELVRHDIRVNALCPGWFLTAMNQAYFESDAGRRYLKRIPMQRLGQMQELDGPLLLLASPAGSYMTGTTVTVDGGICESPI